MSARRCPVAPSDPDARGRTERAAWLEHLDACDACAEAWDAEDPSRMFRALRDEPLPVAILDAVSDGVARAIDADRIAARHRRTRAWLATAAAVVLGVGLGWTAFRSPERGVARPDAVANAAGADASGAHADVRLTSSAEGVQVVDLTVGDRQVVMIFDERMQL